MENLKKFCNTCKEEKDILKIERAPQGEVIELSCGHRIVNVEWGIEIGTWWKEIIPKKLIIFDIKCTKWIHLSLVIILKIADHN